MLTKEFKLCYGFVNTKICFNKCFAKSENQRANLDFCKLYYISPFISDQVSYLSAHATSRDVKIQLN